VITRKEKQNSYDFLFEFGGKRSKIFFVYLDKDVFHFRVAILLGIQLTALKRNFV